MYTVRAQRVSPAPPDRHASVSMAPLDVSAGLMKVRTDTSNLYQKIKSCQRHISGPHFLKYRSLLQMHAEELAAARRALDDWIHLLRGDDARSLEFGINVYSSNDDEVEYVTPEDLLIQLRLDNQILAGSLRSAQMLCQRTGDIVAESLIDVWIDEARRRAEVLMDATWGD